MSSNQRPCMMCGKPTRIVSDRMDLCVEHWHEYLEPSMNDRIIAAIELGFCDNTAMLRLARANDEAMELYPGGALQVVHDCRAIQDIGGHIITTQDMMLWGFPVRKSCVVASGRATIRKYYKPDAWFVWLCTGTIKDIWRHVPYELPWIIFARDNKRVRVYKTSALKRRLASISQRHA